MVHSDKRRTTALQPLIPALYHVFMIDPCNSQRTNGRGNLSFSSSPPCCGWTQKISLTHKSTVTRSGKYPSWTANDKLLEFRNETLLLLPYSANLLRIHRQKTQPFTAPLDMTPSLTIESFGNYFFYTENSNSELKFLVSWRARTQFVWGGDSEFANFRLKK